MVEKRGPGERLCPGARCAIGTPSAWIFLVRLHACRAGLRFSRQGELYPGEGRDTTNGRWPGGDEVRVQEASGQDRGRDSGCIPGDRHGAVRRRWREWEQPHTLSWRSAVADDAKWMSGKSRARLALWS